MIVALLLLASASAAPIYAKNTNMNVTYICYNTGGKCAQTTTCNLSVISHDGINLINNVVMTAQPNLWNYTLPVTSPLAIGTYDAYYFCNNNVSTISTIQVTDMGLATPPALLVVFFLLAFIVLIGVFIYLIVYSIQKFADLAFQLTDLVYNIIAYAGFLIFYQFNIQYMGSAMISSLLLIFIIVGVFSHIFIPAIMTAITFVKKSFDTLGVKI